MPDTKKKVKKVKKKKEKLGGGLSPRKGMKAGFVEYAHDELKKKGKDVSSAKKLDKALKNKKTLREVEDSHWAKRKKKMRKKRMKNLDNPPYGRPGHGYSDYKASEYESDARKDAHERRAKLRQGRAAVGVKKKVKRIKKKKKAV